MVIIFIDSSFSLLKNEYILLKFQFNFNFMISAEIILLSIINIRSIIGILFHILQQFTPVLYYLMHYISELCGIKLKYFTLKNKEID